MRDFAVLGPGGVGGFLAAALARAGADVVVIARADTVAVVKRDGLRVRSRLLGDFEARPAAVEVLEEPVATLFVTTKAIDLGAALERIDARVDTAVELVVPLLNGLDHLPVLRERFDRERVPAAVVRIESDRPAPGVIVQSSPGARIDLAAHDPGTAARLPGLAATLGGAGFDCRLEAGEAQVMWSKLVRLNALASTTAASGLTLGEIRDDPVWRERLRRCVDEGVTVANAEGAALEPQATLAELDGAHATLRSSMQRDLAAGRTPELDAIQGAVLRAGARHGLTCPTVRLLAGEIAKRAGLPPPG